MNRLLSILLASMLPALSLAGPVMVLEVVGDGEAWVVCADTKAVEAMAAKLVGKDGPFENVSVAWRWHNHAQDGRAGGGPSCTTGEWQTHKPATPLKPTKKVAVESTAARRFSDFQEKVIAPVESDAKAIEVEASIKAEPMKGKPTATSVTAASAAPVEEPPK